MKLVTYEMPKTSKECPFSLNHNPNADYWIDIAVDPPRWYCELTKQECDLSCDYCSGLFNADKMKITQLMDCNMRLIGHKFESR